MSKFEIGDRVVVSCSEYDPCYLYQCGEIISRFCVNDFARDISYRVKFDNPRLTTKWFLEYKLIKESDYIQNATIKLAINSNDSVMEEVELGHINRNLSRLALNSNYGVNPTDYYFVGSRGNGKTFESLKRALEILQQPSSITVSKDCIPEINYNGCQDDFPVIDIDSIRRMMKEEEFKMSKPKFKLGDKVWFCGSTTSEVFLGKVFMITGVSYDPARGGGWAYEITKERYDGTTISYSNISQCDLVPYTDYTTSYASRFVANEIFKGRILSPLPPYQPSPEIKIEKAIFNPPYTIVIFSDKSKSIVKCGEGDTYDPEKGLALALCKRGLGTNKSGSNYYDIFKKFLPRVGSFKENTSESHARAIKRAEEQTKKDNNPCSDCPDRKKGCLTNCEKMQEFVNDIQDTEESPKPIEPGYFVKHAEERKNKPKAHATSPVKNEITVLNINFDPKPITHFVEKFDATMFPSNFLTFCKKNNLYFFVVDKLKGGMKAIDPYTTNWQQVTRYLKSGVMESCMKMKDHNINNSFLAVDMDRALFAKLPVELRGENRKGGE